MSGRKTKAKNIIEFKQSEKSGNEEDPFSRTFSSLAIFLLEKKKTRLWLALAIHAAGWPVCQSDDHRNLSLSSVQLS